MKAGRQPVHANRRALQSTTQSTYVHRRLPHAAPHYLRAPGLLAVGVGRFAHGICIKRRL